MGDFIRLDYIWNNEKKCKYEIKICTSSHYPKLAGIIENISVKRRSKKFLSDAVFEQIDKTELKSW